MYLFHQHTETIAQQQAWWTEITARRYT